MTRIALVFAASLALAATPSNATVTTLTVTGKVTDGQICPAPGICTDLTGQSYKTVYTIDDSVGLRFTAPGLWDELRGGTSVFSSPPTPMTAKAYIGGQEYTSLGSYLGFLTTQSAAENNTPNDLQFFRTSDQDIDNPLNPSFSHRNEFTSEIYYTASPDDPMILDPIVGLSPSSIGQIFYFDFTRDLGTGHYTSYFYLLANTNVESAVFNADDGTGNGSVPEPASWALMLGGFGLVGGTMRARRKASIMFAS